jgi:sugar phosphate isomerase/epimerase
MHVDAGRTLHLTYCSNIHPGESFAEVLANIRREATQVKARLRPDGPFGLGLRLSARAASELCACAGALDELRAELDQRGMYAFTLNGFPYGVFHGSPVKAHVYRPDWRDPARVAYTDQLIDILRVLLPQGVSGSISTVPVGFRSEIHQRADIDRSVANLLHSAARLYREHERSGLDIALAIEPEPACHLETTAEAVAFIERELLSRHALQSLARELGITSPQAERVVRKHVGLCFDTCHAAVEFEHAREAVHAIEAAGVRLAKVQATTGLHVEPVDALRLEALRAFADPIYLHQVVALGMPSHAGETLTRFDDLEDALACPEAADARAWRVHFHVPVFEREISPFTNTQPFLRGALAAIVERQLCDQFEVETYTWGVLPEHHRTRALGDMIAEELRWVERELIGEARST